MTFDHEPEDSWHPDDPADRLAVNLGRRIALLDGGAEPTGSTRERLDAITIRLTRVRVRILQLIDDLEHTRRRL